MLDRTFVAAKNSGIGFNVATIPASFNVPSRGAFDPDYMKALFDVGFQPGQERRPRSPRTAAFPGRPRSQPNDAANLNRTIQNREQTNEEAWRVGNGNRACGTVGSHRGDAVGCRAAQARAIARL